MTYTQLIEQLSPDDRLAFEHDRIVWGRQVLYQAEDGKVRRVPPDEWHKFNVKPPQSSGGFLLEIQ